MTARRRPDPRAHASAESWSVDVGAADIAVLDIPPSTRRARAFEIDVRFVARALDAAGAGWLSMNVELNGLRQWSRRIGMHPGAPSDSLDYHCRVDLGVDESLRVRATTQVGGAARMRLRIDAEESPS